MTGLDQGFSVETLPQLFPKIEWKDLLHDLTTALPPKKSSAELLASQMKAKHLLENGVRVTFYCSSHEGFFSFFTNAEELGYCRDVRELLNTNQLDGGFLQTALSIV